MWRSISSAVAAREANRASWARQEFPQWQTSSAGPSVGTRGRDTRSGGPQEHPARPNGLLMMTRRESSTATDPEGRRADDEQEHDEEHEEDHDRCVGALRNELRALADALERLAHLIDRATEKSKA